MCTYVYARVCARVCMDICLCVRCVPLSRQCVLVCVCVCVHALMCMHTCASMHLCVCASVCVCVRACIHVCKGKAIQARKHIHTHLREGRDGSDARASL